MPTSIVQSANKYEASSPTGSVALASAATAGNALVGYATWQSGSLTATVLSDTAGNTWVTKASGTDSGFVPSEVPSGLAPPVTVPSGQFVAWSLPSSAVSFPDVPCGSISNQGLGGADLLKTLNGCDVFNGTHVVWSGFSLPSLPADAVIVDMYPTVFLAGSAGPAFVNSSDFGGSSIGVPSAPFSGQFNETSIGTTATVLEAFSGKVGLVGSLIVPPFSQTLQVTSPVVAVYYTSASQGTERCHTIGYALDCLAGSDTLEDGVSGSSTSLADHNIIEVSDILKFDSFSTTVATSSSSPISSLVATADGTQFSFNTAGSYDNWFSGMLCLTSPSSPSVFKIVFAFVSTTDVAGVSETVPGWTLLHNGPYNGIYYLVTEETPAGSVRVWISIGNTHPA